MESVPVIKTPNIKKLGGVLVINNKVHTNTNS